MEEELYTLAIYEHSDQYGRFVAFEVHATGRRPLWVPADAPRHTVRRRECIFSATRVANPIPDTWLERVIA